MSANKRILVSTIAARSGGVPVMTGFAVDTLRSLGFEPVIAYYEPYSQSPMLSVPTLALGRRRPGAVAGEPMFGCETHAMGAWLPEFEFTTYGLTPQWRELIASCAHHVAVSGNVLAARPLVLTGKKPLAWIATDWHGDRVNRVQTFSALRRVFDRCFVDPLTSRVERQLLQSVHPLALSQHTAAQLQRLGGQPDMPICPTPIETSVFTPAPDLVQPGHIVFSGRLDDPRKNVSLFVDAVVALHRRGLPVRATLMGGGTKEKLLERIFNEGERLLFTVIPFAEKQSLVQILRSADVFAVPSHQEGLCISALEAMACGAPVVSTRCGGPEEFVIPGDTGDLVGFESNEMADAIEHIVRDRTQRDALSQRSISLVRERYSAEFATARFVDAFRAANLKALA
jgi:glycosyltransferase involved in cell wall biosynthesis